MGWPRVIVKSKHSLHVDKIVEVEFSKVDNTIGTYYLNGKSFKVKRSDLRPPTLKEIHEFFDREE